MKTRLNRLLTYFNTSTRCNNNEQERSSYSKIVDCFSLVFLFISLALVLVNIFTLYNTFFSIPHWDYWGWLKLYYSKGFWATATAQYNEHRQFFPCFIFALDQIVDNAQNYFLITALILVQLASFCILLIPAFKILPKAITLITLGFLLLCATWFQQGENLFWPISFHTIFCNFSILLSLYYWSKLLDSFSDSKQLNYKLLGFSILWAVIATFSFGHGIAVWPFFIVISLFKLNRRATLYLIASFTLTLLLYFHNYRSPHSHSNPILSIQRPAELLEYMAVYITRLFLRAEPNLNNLSSSDLMQCYILGAFSIVCSIAAAIYYLSRRRNNTFEHFYTGVIFVGVGSAFITALGRVDFGPLQAGATRYITIQLLFWNGLLILGLCYFCKYSKRLLRILIPLIALLTCLILSSAAAHLQTLNYYNQRKAIQEQIMRGALIQIFDPSRWTIHINPAYNQTSKLLKKLLQDSITVLSSYPTEVIGQKIDQFELPPQTCATILIDEKFSLPNDNNSVVITGTIESNSSTNRDIILVADHESKTIIGWGNRGAGYELIRDGFDQGRKWVVYVRPQSQSGFDYYILKGKNKICRLQR